VMTTEGQGRAGDPVGFGIPVMITGPWGAPKIYPDMQGILDNPDAAYAKLKEMGKGLFGPNSGGLGAALGGLINGAQPGAAGGQPGAAGGQGAARPGDLLNGPLGEAIGNLLQQGLSGGQGQSGAPQGGPGQTAPRPNSQRSIPIPGKPAEAETATPAAPPAQNDDAPQADSQAMNDVLRQLFNR
jgi:AsmA protein